MPKKKKPTAKPRKRPTKAAKPRRRAAASPKPARARKAPQRAARAPKVPARFRALGGVDPRTLPPGTPYPCSDGYVGAVVRGDKLAGRIVACATPPAGSRGQHFVLGKVASGRAISGEFRKGYKVAEKIAAPALRRGGNKKPPPEPVWGDFRPLALSTGRAQISFAHRPDGIEFVASATRPNLKSAYEAEPYEAWDRMASSDYEKVSRWATRFAEKYGGDGLWRFMGDTTSLSEMTADALRRSVLAVDSQREYDDRLLKCRQSEADRLMSKPMSAWTHRELGEMLLALAEENPDYLPDTSRRAIEWHINKMRGWNSAQRDSLVLSALRYGHHFNCYDKIGPRTRPNHHGGYHAPGDPLGNYQRKAVLRSSSGKDRVVTFQRAMRQPGGIVMLDPGGKGPAMARTMMFVRESAIKSIEGPIENL